MDRKRRIRQRGHSLERKSKITMARAGRPELIAEANRVRAMTPGPLEDSVSLLREDRDSQ